MENSNTGVRPMSDSQKTTCTSRSRSTAPFTTEDHHRAADSARADAVALFLQDYAQQRNCRFCGFAIFWFGLRVPTANDRDSYRNVPVNDDLTPHRCHPDRQRKTRTYDPPLNGRTLEPAELAERQTRQKTIGKRLFGRMR